MSRFWYLASPYSAWPGGIDEAYVAACRVTADLVRFGIPVFSPVAHFHGVAQHSDLDPRAHAIWIPADRPFMDAAVGMLLLAAPGWRESKGIAAEIEYFAQVGKPRIELTWPWDSGESKIASLHYALRNLCLGYSAMVDASDTDQALVRGSLEEAWAWSRLAKTTGAFNRGFVGLEAYMLAYREWCATFIADPDARAALCDAVRRHRLAMMVGATT